jgi:proteasome accessory factor B
MVRRIQKGDYPSQKVLAAERSRTPRTIQRDLDYMRDFLGLPLEYDPYRYGYYFSEPVANFPMVSISERELVSVFVAQKALRLYHGTPFERPLRTAFEKLVGSLEGEISVKWADLDSAISFRGIEAYEKDVEALAELSVAVRGRREVEFEYHKIVESRASSVEGGARKDAKRGVRGTESSQSLTSAATGEKGEVRRVRPYHLASIGNQWYLFGYDLMRQDMRKFVPARMRNLRVRETRFERPKDFSVDKLLKGSFGVFSGGELTKMRIRFDAFAARLVKEKRWHGSQKIKELGKGEIEVTFELSSLVEIVPWILGWGEHARAMGPRALVDEVTKVVGRLGRIYGKS